MSIHDLVRAHLATLPETPDADLHDLIDSLVDDLARAQARTEELAALVAGYRVTTATQRRRLAEQRAQLDRKTAIIERLDAQLARRAGQGVAR